MNESFSEFVNASMRARGLSDLRLTKLAHVSFRAISEARSTEFETKLKSGVFTGKRKQRGVSASFHRILVALGEEPRPWMERLGLEVPMQTPSQSFEQRLRLIMEKALTADDLAQFVRAQKELGELFSVEMALRLLVRKYFEL